MNDGNDPRRRVAFPPLNVLPTVRTNLSWRTWAVRVVRMGLVLTAAALFAVTHQRTQISELGSLVSLDEARRLFPTARRLGPADLRRRWHPVYDAGGGSIGVVLRTAPDTNHIIGYAGPSDLLIGLSNEGRVQSVVMLTTSDTPAHAKEVRQAHSFWDAWTGWIPASEPPPKIDAVSGSTLTSLAMAEAIEQRLTGKTLSLRFPQPVTLEEVRAIYPTAAAVHADVPRTGWYAVEDGDDARLGYVIRTAPAADNVIGYRGPTEALLAVAIDEQHVTAVRLRGSYDTPEYVDRVREDHTALELLAGRTLSDWSSLDFQAAGIEGVSGATQTSYALAEGIRQRIRLDSAAREDVSRSWFHRRDAALLGFAIGAMGLCFSRYRGDKRLRRIWQVVLILGFGIWCGDLLSLGMFVGWSRTGLPWSTAPGLLAIAAVALLTPALAGRNPYCHYLCPHGAVQEWMGHWKRWQVSVPAWLGKRLAWLPAILLLTAGLWALADTSFDLAMLEPFDAWGLKGRTAVPMAIAIVGLLASAFVPMAYCRFGCPTGALLKYLVTGNDTRRLGRRDGIAALTLLLGMTWMVPDTLRSAISETAETPIKTEPQSILRGEAFGTTWSVTLRDTNAATAELHQRLSDRLEQIESQFSHWRPQSETAQFNASATTFEVDVSPELMELLRFGARLQNATDGMFDLTVAPLIDLWGFGPSRRQSPPTEAEIAEALQLVGEERLLLSDDFPAVRKLNPNVRIDLGAFLQGYAADQLAILLRDVGINAFLIDIGGELLAGGSWNVAIEDPQRADRPLITLTLTDGALATSGIYRPGPDGTQQTRHIISTRTGHPVDPRWQLCAVQAQSALEADGWATALLAVASPESLEIARRQGLRAIFVDRDGKITRVE